MIAVQLTRRESPLFLWKFGVPSRTLMDWIESESFDSFVHIFADELVGGQAFEHF
jgi:hypothetical protein